MDAPDTVVEALRMLRDDGYTTEFQLVDGVLQWADRRMSCEVGKVEVQRLLRFEGPSDPGDEMVVFGLLDPATNTRGVLASGFGPAADPDQLDHLVGLTTRYRGPWTGPLPTAGA